MNRPPALGLGSIRGLKETKDIEPSQQNEGVLPPIKRRTEKKKESFTSKKNGVSNNETERNCHQAIWTMPFNEGRALILVKTNPLGFMR